MSITQSLFTTNNSPNARSFGYVISTVDDTFRQTLYQVYKKFPERICERLLTSEEKEWFSVLGYESVESFMSSLKRHSCSDYVEARLTYIKKGITGGYPIRVVSFYWTCVGRKDMNLFEILHQDILGRLLHTTNQLEEGILLSEDPVIQPEREGEPVSTNIEELMNKLERVRMSFEEKKAALNAREDGLIAREDDLNAREDGLNEREKKLNELLILIQEKLQ